MEPDMIIEHKWCIVKQEMHQEVIETPQGKMIHQTPIQIPIFFRNMDEVLSELENKILGKLKKKVPSEYELKEKIVLELTLKSLWADDIYEVLDDIKASIKKQFNM